MLLKRNPFYGKEITLDQIKRIERGAVPPQMRVMQSANTWEDLLGVFGIVDEDMIVVSDGSDWFAAFIRLHDGRVAAFAELAKIKGTAPIDWNMIWDTLRLEGFKAVHSYFREGTSYKSFKRQEESFRRCGVELVYDKEVLGDELPGGWEDERLHEVFIKL